MKSSNVLLKQILLITISSGFAVFLVIIFINPTQGGSGIYIKNPDVLQKVVLQKKEPVASGLPVRLKIPSINVDAEIERVGLTPDGAMDAPKSPVKTGWFDLGPRPGDKGSAVIAGHYGWKNGKIAAFDDLYKLNKGDKIYVEDEKGVINAFVVRESRRYDSNADAMDVFVSNDDSAHLNLITCEGIWDKIFKSYSKRLVVFADKVEN